MWFLFGEVSSSSRVAGIGCVILLRHSLGHPYNYSTSKLKSVSFWNFHQVNLFPENNREISRSLELLFTPTKSALEAK